MSNKLSIPKQIGYSYGQFTIVILFLNLKLERATRNNEIIIKTISSVPMVYRIITHVNNFDTYIVK